MNSVFLPGPIPRLLGDLVQIHAEDDPRRSDTTLLVAALLTLGIPPAMREFFHATCQPIHGGVVWRTIWSLRQESKDDRFSTRAMQRAWTNGAWLLANPQHPLAILRNGLTYASAFKLTPRFTVDELSRVETPDTWIEAGARNLVSLLRDMPAVLTAARNLTWFAHDKLAAVPRCLSEPQKKRLLNYVEAGETKRAQLRAA